MSEATIYDRPRLTYRPAQHETVVAKWGDNVADEIVAYRTKNDAEGQPVWTIDLGENVDLPNLTFKGDRYVAESVVKTLAEAFAAREREQIGASL